MISGYARETINAHGLLELREVTFSLSTTHLRQLAEFLITTANRIEDGTLRTGHLHARQALSEQWMREAGCDVIIINEGPTRNAVEKIPEPS